MRVAKVMVPFVNRPCRVHKNGPQFRHPAIRRFPYTKGSLIQAPAYDHHKPHLIGTPGKVSLIFGDTMKHIWSDLQMSARLRKDQQEEDNSAA